MAIGVVAAVVACSEVVATDTQSTALEQIPVGVAEVVETQGEVEVLVETVVVVVIAVAVLVACVHFVLPYEVYRDSHFASHVFYYLFRSFD